MKFFDKSSILSVLDGYVDEMVNFSKTIYLSTLITMCTLLSLWAEMVYANNTPAVKNVDISPLSQNEVLKSIAEVIKPEPVKQGVVDINYGFGSLDAQALTKGDIQGNHVDIEVFGANHPISSAENMMLAYNAASAGHYEAAIILYKQALHANPHNLEALYNIGVIYHKLHQYKEAENYYKQVLSIQPDNKKALHNFLAVIGEVSPEKGLQELMELKKINPNYSPVLAQIAVIYAKLDDYEEAEKYFRKAIVISPQEILYKYNLAVMYDKMEKYKAALKLYEEIYNSSSLAQDMPQNLGPIKQRIAFLKANLHTQR